MTSDDKDKIVGKDGKTGSFVNERGEALKFTKKSMSIYSNTPDEPHDGIHLNYDEDGKTLIMTTHNKDKTEKSINSGRCYLTTACMKHYADTFSDSCYELSVLRWFRDNFVFLEDIKHYYNTAPYIVEGIERENNKDIIYDYIYDNVVDYCVIQIENGNYEEAYKRYKSSILSLEELYARRILGKRLIKTFNK